MKKLVCFILSVACIYANIAVAATAPSSYVSANTYNNMYPYMNNRMRTSLNPGTTPSRTNSQIDVLARTKTTANTTTRRVVPRTTAARAATNVATTSTTTQSARSAMPSVAQSGNTSTTRRVVARPNTTARSATGTTARRSDKVRNPNESNYYYSTKPSESVSAARCLADYTECMNGYCVRENTDYNRCYCSAQLSQIDAKYRPEIDSLINQILRLRSKNTWSDEEMREYWNENITQYTGENSWDNLDAALDIDWASTESRVRGQQAFATGHEYCVQHLKNCAYMASNLRDVYRSDIARDCAVYEQSLQRLKTVAESVVESYK